MFTILISPSRHVQRAYSSKARPDSWFNARSETLGTFCSRCTLPNNHCCTFIGSTWQDSFKFSFLVLISGLKSWMRLHCNQHHHGQVVTTTEDPNKLYNTSMCGTANNRVINGQPVRMKNHQQYFHYIAQLWRIKLVKLSVTLDQYYNEQRQFPLIINIDNILNISGQWEPVSLDVLHSIQRQHSEWS